MQKISKKEYYNKTGKKTIGLSVKCMVFHDGEILLLQKKNPDGLMPWEFPGGGLEFGEDFAAAALRETREETSLDVEILDFAGLWSYARQTDYFLTGMIFVAQAKNKNVVISDEHNDYCWVKPQDLKNYRLQDSLKNALDKMKVRNSKANELISYFCKNYEE